MKKTVIYLLAYILHEEDRHEFAELLSPRAKGVDRILNLGENLLDKLDTACMTESQRYLVATYIHLYAILRKYHLVTDPRLENVREILGMRDTFASFVYTSARRLSCESIANTGSPIKNILNPSEETVKWTTFVCHTAIRQGGMGKKRTVAGLNPSEYEHALDRKYLDALQKTPSFEVLYRKLFEHGIEPFASVQASIRWTVRKPRCLRRPLNNTFRFRCGVLPHTPRFSRHDDALDHQPKERERRAGHASRTEPGSPSAGCPSAAPASVSPHKFKLHLSSPTVKPLP